MATVNYKGLLGITGSVTVTLTTTTIDQLITAIATAEGLPTDFYHLSLLNDSTKNDVVYGDSTTKLSAIGFTDGCSVLCTPDQSGSRQRRQLQKLEIARVKRAAAGDTSKAYYRSRNVYDITQLPIQYSVNTQVDNPNAGGLVVGRPWITLTAGLYRTTYSNYNTNLVSLTVFSTPANKGAGAAVTSLDCATGTANLGYEFVGYILSDYTGTWTFSTGGFSVDDAYTVWIGSNAVSGYTTGNAVFSVSLAQGTGTVSLTSGTYYPIRIQFGNNAGPGAANLYYAHTGQAATSNWTGKIFYSSVTNGF